jgi:segregation and condensation protein A
LSDTLTGEKKYNVKLREFEGPLDLLLHLVKTSEINIYDIPIADITQQYLEYLSYLVELDLDNISEFVEMAATLVLIKSRTMLPVEIDYEEDEADPKEQLIQKLLEYQKYKIAAGLLDARADENPDSPRKDGEPMLFDIGEEDSNWRPLSVIDLITAFAKVLNKKEDSENGIQVRMFDFTVEDKIAYINSLLSESESFNYFNIIQDSMPKMELVCTFLAILELVKQGGITVRQHLIFGDIHIFKKQNLNVAKVESDISVIDTNIIN